MTKAEIVKKIHTRTGIRRSDVNAIVDGFLYAINAAFITIPPHCSPIFKPGKELASKTR